MRGLDGKVAIVPGGATKIGAAVVKAFRDAGTRVMVADINADAGRALEGDGVAFIETDIRDDAQIAALVNETKERFGRIDFLVNVACTYLDNGIDSSRAEWLEALDVNIVGSVMLMQAAREMADRIAASAPVSVQQIKKTVTEAMGRPLDEGYALEDRAKAIVMETEHAREGPRAFMEKRAPRYRGY